MKKNVRIQHTIIMAAGRGNRMRPLSDELPKAMVPYQEGTLISSTLKSLKEFAKFIHVTVGYKASMLSSYLMRFGFVDTVIYTEGHGNSWWIYNSLMRYIDEPVLVLTCDNITELNIDFINREYSRVGSPACMIIPVKPIENIGGDYIEDDAGAVISIQRSRPTNIYASGIQVLNPTKIIALTPNDGDFYSIWKQLIKHGQLYISNIYPKAWFSVNTLEQLESLNSKEKD